MTRCTLAAMALAAGLALPLRAQDPAATNAPAEAEATTPAPESSPSAPSNESPSAELIIDAEQTAAKEPPLAPGEEPLPAMDGKLPGDENIFGSDLFGATPSYTPAPEAQIPERPPAVEDPREAERKQRVQFRKIKASVDRDPQIVQLEEQAATARTPEGYRAARRCYYTVFFGKVRKADPSLAGYCETLEKLAVAQLYQTRVEPTVPLEPEPLPQPAPGLVPAPQFPPADAGLGTADEPRL